MQSNEPYQRVHRQSDSNETIWNGVAIGAGIGVADGLFSRYGMAYIQNYKDVSAYKRNAKFEKHYAGLDDVSKQRIVTNFNKDTKTNYNRQRFEELTKKTTAGLKEGYDNRFKLQPDSFESKIFRGGWKTAAAIAGYGLLGGIVGGATDAVNNK